MRNTTLPNLADLVDYEIKSSWWSGWIGWDWGQELSARYFVWKTKRKYFRYIKYSQFRFI